MNSKSNRFPKSLPCVAGLLAFLFLLNAVTVIGRNMGFFHDELWDMIPAVGMIKADSIAERQEVKIFGYPLPLVTGPYQGALKTWVSAPLLMLVGTSPRMILTLNVFFSMIYLLALYWAVIPAIGRKWAWLVFVSPFFDTNFLLTGPMDMGPSLFQDIFISLTMGALFRNLSDFQWKYYWLTCFFSGCVLAQKLTSIPIVVSFIVITAVLSYPSLSGLAKSHGIKSALKSAVAIPALLFFLPLLPHLIYFYNAGLGPLLTMTADGVRGPYFATLSQDSSFLRDMFSGVDWYQRTTLDSIPAPSPPILAVLSLVVMPVSLILYLASNRAGKCGRSAVVGFALTICAFLLYPAFRGLTRPWHFYILTPLWVGSCIIATIHCLSFCVDRFRKYAAFVSLLFAAGLAAGVIWGAADGVRILRRIERHKGVCMTSPALNDAYGMIKAGNIKMIYAVNYSLAYPIYVLSEGAIRVEDLAWTDLTQEKMGELFAKVRADPEVGIAYRYCGCKEGDASWIKWLNHDPQIFDFLKRLELERATLSVTSCRDDRQTEYVLISQRKMGPSGSGSEK